MPNPCEGTWNDFVMTSDRTGMSLIPSGARLRVVEDPANHTITGHLLRDGANPRESFSGRCIILDTVNFTRARMSFYMLFEGALYYFTGFVRVIRFEPQKEATVDGGFYVVHKIPGSSVALAAAAAVAADPGDTGGWGGNQGA